MLGTKLSGANLFGASLDQAKLYRTNLQKANLCAASLVDADLTGSDLEDANLTGANLLCAKLTSATFSEQTILPDGTTWQPTSDLTRFTNPDHPHCWKPHVGPIAIHIGKHPLVEH